MEKDVTFNLTTAECTLFSIMYIIFIKIDHVSHNTSLNKFQRMFSDQKPSDLKKNDKNIT